MKKHTAVSLLLALVPWVVNATDYFELGTLDSSSSMNSSSSQVATVAQIKSAGTTTQVAVQSGVPSGAIIPFSGECPDGSSEYTPLAGRVIVGAGTMTDVSGTYTYKIGATGGVARHRLTVDEIPSHQHGLAIEPDGTGGTGSISSGPHGPDRTWKTKAEGGNGLHENRMPFYVLRYCKFD